MEIELGIVCGRCDWYSPMKTATCPSCGHGLALFPRSASIPPTARDTRIDAREYEPISSSEAESSKDFVEAGALSESAPPSPGIFLDPLRPRRLAFDAGPERSSSGAI